MTKQLEVEIEVKNFDGYKPAFKGAMQAYGILSIKSARWLQHVTGTGGDSVEHYWKNDCETCKEIAEFISEWIDAAEQSVQPTVEACPPDRHVYYTAFLSYLFCPYCGERLHSGLRKPFGGKSPAERKVKRCLSQSQMTCKR